MNWILLKDKYPDEGVPVMLKIHVTTIGNIVDKEENVLAVYKGKKWFVDGEQLIENDYPIMNTPVAWSKN